MELTKEQIEQIEMEAEKLYPKKLGDKHKAYIAAATKYLMQSIEKDNRIKELEDGLKTFLEWLQINRPHITGAGAPIYILKQLLSTNK